MRVLTTGSRRWRDRERLEARLEALPREGLEIVVGDAWGADSYVHTWALRNDVPVQMFHAEWERFGRSAGPIRNRKMLNTLPDLVLAFRANGESPGTDHCIGEAERRGRRVEVIREYA